jgi:hypothetical protein
MGAGVQTTAILLKFWERYKNGYVIFADTGDEKKETYWFIENYLKPFCQEKGLRWVTVKNKHGFSLMEWCLKRKIIPIRTRRWCTQDFKIKPINRFIRSIGATRKNPIIQDIGISLDESHRANFSKTMPKYVKLEYPLLDAKLTRRECIEIIKNHGWPLPVKSGCDFCPYTKRKDMRELLAKDPERFNKIIEMEKNDRYYPRKPLIGTSPLENLLKNESLDNYVESEIMDTCDSGHCFV